MRVVLIFGMVLGLTLRYVGATTTCPLENRELLLETKKYILAKLGLPREPRNPENCSQIPEHFLTEGRTIDEVSKLTPPHKPCAIVDFLHQRETTTFFPKSIVQYRPKHSMLRSASGVSCHSDTSVDFVKSYRMKFRVDLKSESDLINAELRLRKFRLPLNSTRMRSVRDRVDINLFTPPNDDFKDGKPDYITTEFLDVDSISGLAVFNVTEAVSRWLETADTSEKSGELILDIVFRCPQDMDLFVPNFQFYSEKTTLLITTSQRHNTGSTPQRTKRQSSSDDEDLSFCDSKRATCCLKKFKINFERDLNWTWVVSPKELSFNYCGGLCPITGVSNFHSQFLGILRTLSNNPTAAGNPCCVPNSYRSHTIGIIINASFQYLELPDIEATSCACR